MDRVFDDKEANFVIELLNQANSDNSIESYIYIKNLLDTILIPLSVRKVPQGTRLVRCRPHLKGEEFFNSVSELSYIKDINKINNFGRANEPGQSMFYCSDNKEVSFIETSQITRENIAKEYEYMTTSVWEASKDLLVVNILSNNEIRGLNKNLDSMSKEYEDFIEEKGTTQAMVVQKFLHYISKEFTRDAQGDSNNYKISCAFSNYVFNNLPMVDGILYPSVLYRSEGLNFVFKPSSVDEKLKFYAARRGKMEKTTETQYFETEIIDSKIHIGRGTEIKWMK